MGQLIWQIKQLLSKVIALAVVGAICFGGYSLYKKGAFRGGVAHAGKVILKQIPYFGSRFKHYLSSGKSRKTYRPVTYRSQSKRGRVSKSRKKHSSVYRRSHRGSRGRR